MDGILLVDKEPRKSSHDVVAEVRFALGDPHAGHAGTLDPMATGLLVVVLGTARRLLPYMEDHDKEYLFAVRLGVVTDTDDAEGRVVEERDASGVTRETLEASLVPFRGSIRQRPPAFSAVKVEGRRAYQLARRGQAVDLPEREVTVYQLTLLEFAPRLVRLRMHCSRGTYVRSVARDLGASLGCGGSVAELHRTASGPFRIEQAIRLAEHSEEEIRRAVLPVQSGVLHLPEVDLGEGEALKFSQGQFIDVDVPGPIVRVHHEGKLLGIGEPREGRLKARVVLGGKA